MSMPSAGCFLAIVVLASTGGCKPTSATGTSADASTGAPATSAAGKHAAVPANVCALFSPAAVDALIGEKTEARDVPGGGCQWFTDGRTSPHPTVSVAEDFAGAGGIDGAKAGAQAMCGGVAAPLSVNGAPGYVVTGNKMMGSTMTQAAVAVHGLIVTVTIAGGEKARNEKVGADLLKMALAKL